MKLYTLFSLVLLQIPSIDTSSTVTVLGWVASISVLGLVGLATFYVKQINAHREEIAKLNSSHREEIAATNLRHEQRLDERDKEIREVYERSSERIMEWRETLLSAAEQMAEGHPMIIEALKDLTTKDAVNHQEIVSLLINKKNDR